MLGNILNGFFIKQGRRERNIELSADTKGRASIAVRICNRDRNVASRPQAVSDDVEDSGCIVQVNAWYASDRTSGPAYNPSGSPCRF